MGCDRQSARPHRAAHSARDRRRGDRMRRREFITLIGCAAAWPLAARAQQQSGMPIIGYLSVRSNDNYLVEALRRGLRETGYVEGQNVAIEYRWAMGQYDRMPPMAAELARLALAVLVKAGGQPAAPAAKAATSTIPVVFVLRGGPVTGWPAPAR